VLNSDDTIGKLIFCIRRNSQYFGLSTSISSKVLAYGNNVSAVGLEADFCCLLSSRCYNKKAKCILLTQLLCSSQI